MGAVQKRFVEHNKAVTLMLAASYEAAISILLSALKNYGPHVGLLSDLASSAYLSGRIDLFNRATSELYEQFQSNKYLLSDESYMKTCLSLGKLLEETAQVSLALKLYEEASLDRPFFKLTQFQFCQKTQIQILRLKSFLGLTHEVGELYRNSIQIAHADTEFDIEIEHSLMLAELSLFGPQVASHRYTSLIKKVKRSNDMNLVFFDLCEELLRLNEITPTRPSNLSDFNTFEEIVLALSKNLNFSLSTQELFKVQRSMSTLCYLRICILNLKRNPQIEVRKQIMLILDSLVPESRIFLEKKWFQELSFSTEQIEIKIESNGVVINSEHIKLPPNGFELNCLHLLAKQPTIATDDIIRLLYDIIPDQFSEERVRIALLRLNKKLKMFSGLHKTVNFTRLKVNLHANVKLIG